MSCDQKSKECLPPPHRLSFRIGDLVLCRYSTYPYWPATIEQCALPRWNGKYVCRRRTRGGRLALAFWCYFRSDKTSGWVRADRIVHFHPALLHRVRVSYESRWFEAQTKSISAALRAFESKHRARTFPISAIPPLPPDLANKWNQMRPDELLHEYEEENWPEDEGPSRSHRAAHRSRQHGAVTIKQEPSYEDHNGTEICSGGLKVYHNPRADPNSVRTKRKDTGPERVPAPTPKQSKSAELHPKDPQLNHPASCPKSTFSIQHRSGDAYPPSIPSRKKRKDTGPETVPAPTPKRSKSAELHAQDPQLNHPASGPKSTFSTQHRSGDAYPPSIPSQSQDVGEHCSQHATPSKSCFEQVAALKRQLKDMQCNLDLLRASAKRSQTALNGIREKIPTASLALGKSDSNPLEPQNQEPDPDISPLDATPVKPTRDAHAVRFQNELSDLMEEQSKIINEYAGLLSEVSDGHANAVRFQTELSDLMKEQTKIVAQYTVLL